MTLLNDHAASLASSNTTATDASTWPRFRPALAKATIALVLSMACGAIAMLTIQRLDVDDTPLTLNGGKTNALAHAFDEALPFRDGATRFWSWVDFGLLGSPKTGAIMGREGWIFSREEFAAAPAVEAVVLIRLAAIQTRLAWLQARGIGVVIVLIPAKARTYKALLAERRPPEVLQPVYELARTVLETDRVSAPDLASAFSVAVPNSQVFMATDTHWSPAGAAIAALLVSDSLPKAQRDRLKTIDQCGPSDAAAASAFTGDLQKFIGPGAIFRRPEVTLPGAEAGCVSAGTDLLSATMPAIVLVGTSYSADPRWGFANALSRRFQAEITNAAIPGQGPFAAIDKVQDDAAFKTNPPSLVIWEIPERYLWAPCTGAQHDVC